MITRTGRLWPIGGMPPMTKPGQVVGLAGGRPADARLAGDRGQPGDVDPVRAGDEADDRLEAAVLVGRDEDERLDDLAELRADGRGGVGGGVGALREDAGCRASSPCAPRRRGRAGWRDARRRRARAGVYHARSGPVPGVASPDGRDPLRLGRHARRLARPAVPGEPGGDARASACRTTRRPTGRPTSRTGAGCIAASASPRTGSTRRTSSGAPPTTAGPSNALFPGTADALDRLAGTGPRLGLVTAGERSVVAPAARAARARRALRRRGLRRRPAGPQAGPGAAPGGPGRRSAWPTGRRPRPTSATSRTTCGWPARPGRRAIGIASLLADRADLLAAGAHEVATSVAEWVDRAIGIMLVDRLPRAPAV